MIKTTIMEQNVESKHSIIAEYYTECYDELKAFVASRLPGEEDAEQAEDIVQNVFVRLLKMDRMITRITLPCLVYTIARNLIYDYLRRRHCMEKYEYVVRTSSWQNKCVDDVDTIYSVLEIQKILENGIAQLSEKQSNVYRLDLEGMKVKDIALQLNIKYKNAEHCLGDARKVVRRFVKEQMAS